MKIILVVDGDLGFIVYLSLALIRAGYMAVPSTTVEGAKSLLSELEYSSIDLLIANFSLPGALGLLKEFERGPVRIIQIDDPRVAGIKRLPADGKLRKAVRPDSVSRWLGTVRRVLGKGVGDVPERRSGAGYQ